MTWMRLSAVQFLIPLLALGLAAVTGWGSSPFSEAQVPEMRLWSLDGEQVQPFQDASRKTKCQQPPSQALLFLFVRSDCPISNRFAPEVRRLFEKFSPRGVSFWLAYPDRDEPVAEIRQHLEEYGLLGCVLRDPHHDLAKLAGASITPEAAVFSPQGELLYRGRIDDRFVDFGKARAAPTRRDLEEALEAILEGRPVPHPRTQAVGCYLSDLK